MFLRQCRIESKADPSFLAQNRFTGNRTEGLNPPSPAISLRIYKIIGSASNAAELRLKRPISMSATIVNTCGQLKTKLGVYSLPKLMRIAIQHLPSSGKQFKD